MDFIDMRRQSIHLMAFATFAITFAMVASPSMGIDVDQCKAQCVDDCTNCDLHTVKCTDDETDCGPGAPDPDFLHCEPKPICVSKVCQCE